MSFLMPKPPKMEPQPLPMAPTAADNTEAERQRLDAERAAIAESKTAGRRSTIVAGMKIADEEQQERGMMSASKRRAAREMVG